MTLREAWAIDRQRGTLEPVRVRKVETPHSELWWESDTGFPMRYQEGTTLFWTQTEALRGLVADAREKLISAARELVRREELLAIEERETATLLGT